MLLFKIGTKQLFLLTCLVALTITGFAQVKIDNTIKLVGQGSDRTIENLAYPETQSSAVNAESVVMNSIKYASATGSGSHFNLSLSLTGTVYSTGMVLHFLAPGVNDDSLTIAVNNLPAKYVKFKDASPLDSGIIQQGQAVTLVYDGNAFQIISPAVDINCPVGFIVVNEKYCIQQNENAASDFFTAVQNCYDQGARLCTWGEWYYACQNTNLALSNMVNNYEWVDDAANEDGSFRVSGAAGSCTQNSATPATNNFFHRCCFSR